LNNGEGTSIHMNKIELTKNKKKNIIEVKN